MTEQWRYCAFAIPNRKGCLAVQGPLDVVLFNKDLESIVDFLVVPLEPSEIIPEAAELHADGVTDTTPDRCATGTKSLDRSCEPSPEKCISRLPAEMFLMIVNHLGKLADQIAFGMTCRRLWQLTVPVFYAVIKKEFGSWSGERLIFVGGHREEGNYFPDLLAPPNRNPISSRPLMDPTDTTDRWYFGPSPGGALLDLRGELMLRKGHRDADFVRAAHDLGLYCDKRIPSDLKWRLVNLTTREFVRAEHIAVRKQYIHGPYIDHIGFAEVLIVRTCWVGTHHDAHPQLRIPSKGSWAGHQFAIMTEARLQQDIENLGHCPEGPMKDVSEEVAGETYAIWEARFGSDWRELIGTPDFKPPVHEEQNIPPGNRWPSFASEYRKRAGRGPPK